jgi:hypothetical protein
MGGATTALLSPDGASGRLLLFRQAQTKYPLATARLTTGFSLSLGRARIFSSNGRILRSAGFLGRRFLENLHHRREKPFPDTKEFSPCAEEACDRQSVGETGKIKIRFSSKVFPVSIDNGNNSG